MTGQSRLEDARAAYKKKDIEKAAAAHLRQRITSADEKHGSASSQYIGSMVYGGLDGIITTFAVVSGVAGAQLGPGIIIILGVANLLADGFSMATGAYLSSKSENEYYERERQREHWEVENFPEGERDELLELYQQKGYPEEDAQKLVELKTKEPERWVDAMMIEELGLLKSDLSPMREAITTFASFVIAGSVPLLYYLLDLVFHFGLPQGEAFAVATGLSAVALFLLGAAKVFITERNPVKGGLETLAVGGLAAAVAYVIGDLLKGFGG